MLTTIVDNFSSIKIANKNSTLELERKFCIKYKNCNGEEKIFSDYAKSGKQFLSNFLEMHKDILDICEFGYAIDTIR